MPYQVCLDTLVAVGAEPQKGLAREEAVGDSGGFGSSCHLGSHGSRHSSSNKAEEAEEHSDC